MRQAPAPGGTPREALTRRAGVAVTLCLFAWLALLPPSAGVAQDRSRSPTPEKLWEAYPLAPTAAPSAQPTAASSPAAPGQDDRRPLGAARSRTDDSTPVGVLVLLALLTAGGTITFLRIRRRRESEPHAAAAKHASTLVRAVPAIPALWHGRSGRFIRPTRTSGPRATVTVASAQAPGRGGPRAADDAPVPRLAAVPLASDPSSVTPAPAAVPAGSPPDRRLAWTAEIEWRHADGESRFCVVARGAGTVVMEQSPPHQWPPIGPAAVHAMTDAAERLTATLAAAGWKPLPPGPAWYAKRFAWEPVVSERADASPVKSTAAADASSSPVTPLPAPAGGGAPDHLGSNRSRWRRVALLCVLVSLGPIAALALSVGQDDAPVVRPAPVTQAPDTPTAQPTTKPAAPSNGIDLSVPLVVLLGLVSLVLAISRARRMQR